MCDKSKLIEELIIVEEQTMQALFGSVVIPENTKQLSRDYHYKESSILEIKELIFEKEEWLFSNEEEVLKRL